VPRERRIALACTVALPSPMEDALATRIATWPYAGGGQRKEGGAGSRDSCHGHAHVVRASISRDFTLPFEPPGFWDRHCSQEGLHLNEFISTPLGSNQTLLLCVLCVVPDAPLLLAELGAVWSMMNIVWGLCVHTCLCGIMWACTLLCM
jgi:hypothetical protein